MKFYERINVDLNQMSRDHVEQQLIEWLSKAGLGKLSNAPLTFGSWFSKPTMSVYSFEHGYEVQVTIQPNGRWLVFTLSTWIYMATVGARIFVGGEPSSLEILVTMFLAFACPFLLLQIDRVRISGLVRMVLTSLQMPHRFKSLSDLKSQTKINEDLERLVEFNKQGILSAEDFQKAKDKLLSA
jgi:hypothetical protein